MVTRSGAGPKVTLPYRTPAEYDEIDKELGREKVQDVLEDYLNETATMVQELICENSGITGCCHTACVIYWKFRMIHLKSHSRQCLFANQQSLAHNTNYCNRWKL